jgi:hypothetical protein
MTKAAIPIRTFGVRTKPDHLEFYWCSAFPTVGKRKLWFSLYEGNAPSNKSSAKSSAYVPLEGMPSRDQREHIKVRYLLVSSDDYDPGFAAAPGLSYFRASPTSFALTARLLPQMMDLAFCRQLMIQGILITESTWLMAAFSPRIVRLRDPNAVDR